MFQEKFEPKNTWIIRMLRGTLLFGSESSERVLSLTPSASLLAPYTAPTRTRPKESTPPQAATTGSPPNVVWPKPDWMTWGGLSRVGLSRSLESGLHSLKRTRALSKDLSRCKVYASEILSSEMSLIASRRSPGRTRPSRSATPPGTSDRITKISRSGFDGSYR